VRAGDALVAALVAGLPGLPGLTVTQFTITSANGAGAGHARTEVAEGPLVTLKAAVLTKRATGPARPAAQSTNAPSWGCANIAPARPAAKPGIAEAVAAHARRFTKAGANAKVAVAFRASTHATLTASARPTTDTNATTGRTAAHGALTALTGTTADTNATTHAGRGIACAGAAPARAANAECASRRTHVAEEATHVGTEVAGIAEIAGIARIAERSIKARGAGGSEARRQSGRIAGHAEGRIMRRRHRLGGSRSAGQALYATNGAKITRVRSANA
jgi:hypothetical protein